jgi:uncharacterized RDD family membrane protein YckC
MAQSPSPWTAPEPDGGPAPGVEFASPGARLVGYIVDIVIQGALFLAIVGLTVVAAAIFPPLLILGLIAWFAVFVAYFPYFWSKSGQTPGMRLMQIKVVRDADGGPVSVGQAILRLIGFWVSGFVFYIGYIWIFVDKRRRGWMDLIAGTIVISAPSDLTS